MSISIEKKNEIMKSFAVSDNDTGSAYVQVAIMTERVYNITEHLKKHKKDFHTRHGLLKILGKRRNLLLYLKKNDKEGYATLIKRLNLRK